MIFLVFWNKSENVVQSQQSFARTHVRVSVTFKHCQFEGAESLESE